VPAMEIPWWNTVTDQLEVAHLPAHEILVTAAAEENEPPATSPAPPVSVNPGAPAESPVTKASPAVSRDHWFWIAVVCGLGWLLTGLAWWWSRFSIRGRELSSTKGNADAESERQLIRAVEKACKANDARAARQAVDRWAEFRWPDLFPGIRELRFDYQLGLSLSELNRSLFSGRDENWNGADLLRAIRQFAEKDDEQAAEKNSNTVLAALYK